MGKAFALVFFVFSFIVNPLWAEDDEVHEFRGMHLIASYSGCDVDAIGDPNALVLVMKEAVQKCGANILDSSSYTFDGGGMTMVILLSESHASIHTYPEHGACFVDLFTCGDKCSHAVFDQALRDYLKPTEVNQKILIRHQGIEEK